MDAGFVLKLGRIFRTPYGGHGVDFVDALNYQFTGGLLVIFIAVIGIRQYVGKSIQCWVPQEFTNAWEEYIENLCWVSSTYFLYPDDQVPMSEQQVKQHKQINYYQWVAMVLAAQAVMGWVPYLVWRVRSSRLPLLIKSAREATVPQVDLRRKAVHCLVATLEEQAEVQARYQRDIGVLRKMLYGVSPNARLSLLFVTVRLLFIANAAGQIYLMRAFIGSSDLMFGYSIARDLLSGREWETSGHFPRVTYCTIPVRKLGNQASYTVQCVLPINHFVEKIYVFLWFWYIIVALLTMLSTLQWLQNTLLPFRRTQFIKQYLRALKLVSSTEERDLTRFVNNSLGPDGIFTLHVVSNVASDLITLDVVASLWKNYRQSKITGISYDIARLLTEKPTPTDKRDRIQANAAV